MSNADPGRLYEALARYRTAIEVSFTSDDVAKLAASSVSGPRVHTLVLDGAATGDLSARLVDRLLLDALDQRASDLHLLSAPDALEVSFRVDGALRIASPMAAGPARGVIDRLRALAGLPTGERGRPRQGAFELHLVHDGPPLRVGIRVTTCPSRWGDLVAVRLLPNSILQRDLGALGMDMSVLDLLRGALRRKYGAVLLSGPPNNGRSTTLCAAASEMVALGRSVAMVSEVVELPLAGVAQVRAGAEMAGALRAVLRSDPDVVLVDGLRDQETAQVAMHAALGGRLVLATFDAVSAGGALSRLQSLGVPPRLLVPAVKLVSCQKLVRGICPDCAEPAELSEGAILDLGIVPQQLDSLRPMRGGGCAACAGTGYRGRLGIFEAVEMSRDLGELILKGAEPVQVKTAVRGVACTTLQVTALARFEAGRTTLEEIAQV